MLSIPYSYSLAGWGTALMVMFGLQIAAVVNLYFIMKSCDMIREMGIDASSYKGMAIAAWGGNAGKIADAIVGFYTASTLVAYGILVVQFFQPPMRLASMPSWMTSKPFIIFICAVVLIRLCTLKKIEGLKFTSIFGNISLLYATILVFSNFCSSEVSDSVSVTVAGAGVLQALPIFVFSYNFHYNMPVYYNDLEGRSIRKMLLIVAAVYTTVTVSYVVIGISGYFSFGDLVKSNVMESLPNGTAVTISRVLLGMMIVFTYPVVQFATRGAVARTFDLSESSIYLAIGIITVTMLLSALIPNIGIVLGYNGAIFGVAQHYFIPSLAFYNISGRSECQDKIPNVYRTGALFVCASGVIVGILGLVGTTINIIEGNSR